VEPQEPGVVFPGVFEGPERAVVDALDVPGVKELVRGQLGEALVPLLVLESVAGDVERATVPVLEATAAGGQGVDDEQVARKREPAE
jgi:hypothetical protein